MNTTSTHTRTGPIMAAHAVALPRTELRHAAGALASHGLAIPAARRPWITAVWAVLEAWQQPAWPPHAGWPQ